MIESPRKPVLIRSALYVPLANPRACGKAAGLPADVVIYDLEDSVAGPAKDTARQALATIPRLPGKLVALRVNAADQADHVDDVMAAMASDVDAILLPKVRQAADIDSLRKVMGMSGVRRPVAVWAMIETPASVLALPEIARAIAPSGVLVLGLNDLAKETGMLQVPGRLPMLPVLTEAILSARAAGCLVLDAVFNAIQDSQGFEAEALQARSFGFDGKTVIHPNQIAPANRVFGPSAAEIAEAEAIVAAFSQPENRDKGVIQMDGRMVERLHRDMAEALLERARLIAARDLG